MTNIAFDKREFEQTMAYLGIMVSYHTGPDGRPLMDLNAMPRTDGMARALNYRENGL